MLKQEQLINKLRSLGYAYKRQADRTVIYRRGTHRVFVPRCNLLEESLVRRMLQQCGVDADEIEKFIAAAKA